jgi:hypothetical protein
MSFQIALLAIEENGRLEEEKQWDDLKKRMICMST